MVYASFMTPYFVPFDGKHECRRAYISLRWRNEIKLAYLGHTFVRQQGWSNLETESQSQPRSPQIVKRTQNEAKINLFYFLSSPYNLSKIRRLFSAFSVSNINPTLRNIRKVNITECSHIGRPGLTGQTSKRGHTYTECKRHGLTRELSTVRFLQSTPDNSNPR